MSEDATLDEFATEAEPEEGEHILRLGPKQVEIPNSWNVATFEEVNHLDKPIGYGVVKPGEHVENGTPLVKIEDVVDGYLNSDQNFHQITDEKDKKYSRSKLSGGEVLVSIQGTVGNVVIAPPEMAGANISRTIARITPERPNNYWIKYYIESKPVQDYIYVVSSGSTRASYNIGDIRKTNVALPPLPEQRKIATVLYTVDQAIEKTEEVITQTERLRDGVMQNVFSRGVWDYSDFQETKYGTIPAGWEVKPVREIAERIGSGGTPNTDKEDYYGGKIKWVKTDDLNSGLVESAKTTITAQGLDESAAKLFPEGTVVFAMYGGALGQNGRLGMEAAMNQACCGIVTNESEMNSYLLHQQLIHRKKQLTALSAGTHQQNISQSMIEKFEVFVPPLDEQKEMVDILKSIERTIEANTNEKERLKRLKRGLMQDLLSGTVRTTDTTIEVPEEIAQYG